MAPTAVSLDQFGGREIAGSYLNYRKRIGAKNARAKQKKTKTLIGGDPNSGFIVQYMQTAQQKVMIDTKM